MELLLHYVWRHRLYPPAGLTTTDGREVEILDPGLHNSNAGPDFFNAKIRLDGMLWVGNVEIHDKSSDWYVHGHDHDERYDNVVLHVAEDVDCDVRTSRGDVLPQLCLSVPEQVKAHYEQLLSAERYPPCYRIIATLSRIAMHSWLAALQTERLEQKTEAIRERVERCNGSWEDAFFVTMARSFGFGVNGDAFELWAESIPLHSVDHHRDNLFQIEAIFMGQAGFLDPQCLHAKYKEQALQEGYFSKMRNEYLYLQHKFSLHPIDGKMWHFLRLRPQNFPTIRIAQLANLYYSRRWGLQALAESSTLKEARETLLTEATPYWRTHYLFGATSKENAKQLSKASQDVLLINACVPMLFAYGRHKGDDRLCDRAFDFLEELKPEQNHIVSTWKDVGFSADNAGDSQALIQLKKEYCDKKYCLRCRIGYEYLKDTTYPKAVNEEEMK